MITTWPESVKGLSTARGAAGEQVSGWGCRPLPQPVVSRSPRGCRMAAIGAQPSRCCVCGTRGDEGLLQSHPPGPELQSRCPTLEGTPRPGAKVLPGPLKSLHLWFLDKYCHSIRGPSQTQSPRENEGVLGWESGARPAGPAPRHQLGGAGRSPSFPGFAILLVFLGVRAPQNNVVLLPVSPSLWFSNLTLTSDLSLLVCNSLVC